MSWPVTVLADGGMPVSESASGTPMTPMADGGMPVTIIADGGMPVTFVDNDFQLSPQGLVGANFILPDSLHPSLSIARAGETGTYIDAQGALQTSAANTLRYDYSNPNGAGWLIEKAETNIIDFARYAEGIAATGASASGTAAALDGTAIDRFLSSGSAEAHRLTSAFTDPYTGADIYTFSKDVYIPSGSDVAAIWTTLRTTFASQRVRFTYSGGVLTPASFAAAGSSPPPVLTAADVLVRQIGPNWLRVNIVGQASSVNTTFSQMDVGWSVSTTETAAGTANTFIALDNFQVSLGDNRGLSRIGAGLTRAADDVSLLLSNLPQWNPLEGTFVVDFVAGASVASKTLLDIHDGTTDNRIQVVLSSGGLAGLLVTVGGVSQAAVYSAAAVVASTRNKIAVSFKADEFNLALNGTLATADTSGSMPVVDRVQFGANLSKTASTFLNGHIISARYLAGALTSANLIAMTS